MPSLEDLLLNKYGHLFGISSFEDLNSIVRRNKDGLPHLDNEVLKLRFGSRLNGTEISKELNIFPPRVYIIEKRAMKRVLANLRSKQLYNLSKEELLNMPLPEFAEHIPSTRRIGCYARLKRVFSGLHDKKLKDLVNSGASIIKTYKVGFITYEVLRSYLSRYNISLDKASSHYGYLKRYYPLLSSNCLEDARKALLNYKRVLTEQEFKILELRLKEHSLSEVAEKVGLSSRERVRQLESRAIKKIEHHSTSSLENYTKSELLKMDIPDFVKLIPPVYNYTYKKIKKVLLANFSDHTLGYVVANPNKLMSSPDFYLACFNSLQKLLQTRSIYFYPYKSLQ